MAAAVARLAVHVQRVLLTEPRVRHLDALVVELVQLLVCGGHGGVGAPESLLCHGSPPVGKTRVTSPYGSRAPTAAPSRETGVHPGQLTHGYRDSGPGRWYHRVPLRLVTYDRRGHRRLGALLEARVVSLPDLIGHPAYPNTMERLVVSNVGTVLDAARAALERDDVELAVVAGARRPGARPPTSPQERQPQRARPVRGSPERAGPEDQVRDRPRRRRGVGESQPE